MIKCAANVTLKVWPFDRSSSSTLCIYVQHFKSSPFQYWGASASNVWLNNYGDFIMDQWKRPFTYIQVTCWHDRRLSELRPNIRPICLTIFQLKIEMNIQRQYLCFLGQGHLTRRTDCRCVPVTRRLWQFGLWKRSANNSLAAGVVIYARS